MDSQSKINQLKSLIRAQLTPLIDNDYYLLELPYYTNIGDTMIWQGELDFLATLPFKCLGMYSKETFSFTDIDEQAIILLQGGGNFGDLWYEHHLFKLNVVQHYPHNKIIFLPQSVYFEHEENLLHSVRILAQHPNVTICARDNVSYHTLCTRFHNTVLLIPDMAFYISPTTLNKYIPRNRQYPQRTLYVKRNDKETTSDINDNIANTRPTDVADWPTMEHTDKSTWFLIKMMTFSHSCGSLIDWFVRHYYRHHLLKKGVHFIMPYQTIISTRLHTAVLGLLLGKIVILNDNSYGKNAAIYNTWLTDCESISLI